MKSHIERQRAAEAYRLVDEVARKGEETQKKYRSVVRGLPAMIQTCGLAQTLAFLFSKKGNENVEVAEHVCSGAGLQKRDAEAVKEVLDAHSAEYRRRTVEALSFVGWLKRFAEARLAAPED